MIVKATVQHYAINLLDFTFFNFHLFMRIFTYHFIQVTNSFSLHQKVFELFLIQCFFFLLKNSQNKILFLKLVNEVFNDCDFVNIDMFHFLLKHFC